LWFNFPTEQTVGPGATCVVQIQPLSPDTRSPQNRHQQATQADSSCPCYWVQVSMCCAEIFGCLLVLQRSYAMTQQASLGRKPCTPVPARVRVGSSLSQNLACTECVCLCKGSVCLQLVPCCGQPSSPYSAVQVGLGWKPSKCLTTGVHNKHGCCMRGTQCPVCSMTGVVKELGVR
jgi:hypothetical protein